MSLAISISQISDGSMKSLTTTDFKRCQLNRCNFLQKHGIKPDDTTYFSLNYIGDDYCRYLDTGESHRGDGVSRPSSIIADALITTSTNHALFLPVADCIAAVLYDPTTRTLMLSHLGRHNLEQFGGTKSVEYLAAKHRVDPKNLKIWLGPAAGKNAYPLYAFGGRGLHEVAKEQIEKAAVPTENITTSPILTTDDGSYYSHSEFLKGNRKIDGRFAVVAMMV